MRKIYIVVFCFISLMATSQKKKSTTLGKTTLEELKMTVYDKDSTATAVVLYEHGNYYVNPKRNFQFTTDYYFRIKILKKRGFDQTIIKIPFYGKEEVHDIKAVTSNLSEKNVVVETSLTKDEIYTKDGSGKWKETSFTLPNANVGSVIEYRYSLTSPYSQIDDWSYQSDIPKLKSDFTAAILGNWKYNIRIIGKLKLSRDSSYVKNGCVYVPGIATGSCSIIEYGMDSIPAFKEEAYMLSKDNFLSRVAFQLKSSTNVKGQVTNYTKTWKHVDKNLKTNFLGNQNSKKKYFKNKMLADAVLSVENTLSNAKKIYSFIQSHYTWDEKYWSSKKVDVKKAFEDKKGNVFDINLSLYYALQAENIESKLVLLSTRDREIPTKLYPVISEFNYLIVKATINNKVYFLDAVNEHLPFGLIQFESLNGDGRVMDFKNGSFWEQIKLGQKSSKRTMLSLSLTNTSLTGDLSIKRNGYYASNYRAKFNGRSDEDIIGDLETRHPDIEVEDFKLGDLSENEKALNENYKINIETDFTGENKIRLSPFLVGRITTNPFKLESRDYPVDFGYARAHTYLIKLTIPKEYKVTKLPKNMGVTLPNKGGKILLNVNQSDTTINIYLKYTIHKKRFNSNEYFYLKQFYQKLIDAQSSIIELERI